MKVIIDAQLPIRLSNFLSSKGIDSIHTLNLPDKNKTSDSKITSIAEKEARIVITKDRDFFDNYILKGIPKKLIIITTGNISNDELLDLIDKNLHTIKSLLKRYAVIELNEVEVNVLY